MHLHVNAERDVTQEGSRENLTKRDGKGEVGGSKKAILV